ncbi:hypothetical protein V5F29_05440 [Xanthobacter aminoxidans]|uniref:hypothetical protein n=1 Tax=Xanthobacter aminoxidans TaxID=186280 RepID=UPI00372B026C
MKDILAWMGKQSGGAHTYLEFQKRMHMASVEHRENAAAARLLADLAGRFVDTYDGGPLPAGIARDAYGRLKNYVERAVAIESLSVEAKLDFLNELGSAELAVLEQAVPS